jgi:hypothetical protein
MRRTRRTPRTFATLVLAAAAVLATAPPGSAGPDGSGTDRAGGAAASTTVIRPSDLDRGGARYAPDAVWSLGRTIHVGGRTVRLDRPGHLTVHGRSGRAVVASTFHRQQQRLWRVGPRGQARLLDRRHGYADVQLSPDGRRYALLEQGRRHGTLVTESARTGRTLTTQRVSSAVELHAMRGRRVLLASWEPAATYWLDPVARTRTVVARREAWHVDLRSGVMALAVRDDDGYDGYCLRYTTLERPHTTLWYSCRQRPAAVSPDGRRMLTMRIETDGLGTGTLQLRSTDGTRLRTYRTGLFGSVGFDADGRIVAGTMAHRRATVAVCRAGEDCRRVSPVRWAARPDRGTNQVLRFSLAS